MDFIFVVVEFFDKEFVIKGNGLMLGFMLDSNEEVIWFYICVLELGGICEGEIM